MQFFTTKIFLALIIFCCLSCDDQQNTSEKPSSPSKKIKAVNENSIPLGENTIAIVGATLIDVNNGEPVSDAVVVVNENEIVQVGRENEVTIPDDAEVVEAQGMYLMPGMLDSHFHGTGTDSLPNEFLQNGVTSIRDPGAWMEGYDQARSTGLQNPRFFLTGPHFDQFPPAYPTNSVMIRDEMEARNQVNFFADKGASAIKVYIRLPPKIIQAICEASHARGLPVIAHLEITNAIDAIRAGLDGIEHITSFGTALVPRRQEENYRQAVLEDNSARREGRYEMWNTIDINTGRADSLINLILEKEVFVSPTLGVFEYRLEEDKQDTVKANAFQTMLDFTGKVHETGAKVVVGSHTYVPYADRGFAYQREMELLVESGLSNMEVIKGATINNAQFFRIDHRLGSIEEGKQADLVLVNGNPLKDIKNMYKVDRVMLNGVWVEAHNK